MGRMASLRWHHSDCALHLLAASMDTCGFYSAAARTSHARVMQQTTDLLFAMREISGHSILA